MIAAPRWVLAMVVCAGVAQPGVVPVSDVPASELSRRVREAVRLDNEVQAAFTYLEIRRDIKISKLGKVTVGPPRTFEVRPDAVPGRTYKRLIAVNGVPLSTDELTKRDAEHQKTLADEQEKIRRESPAERAERLENAGAEQRQREQILDDAFKVFEARIEGRTVVDGQPVLIARMTPRRDADVATREGRWMKQFEGQLWIAEADAQIVRVDMRATGDVTIGWGVVGRVHKGTRVLYVRRRFQDAWLPAETTYEASGRTLIFRPFQFTVTTTYSDYRRRDKSVND